MKRKKNKKLLRILSITLAMFCIIALLGITIAHNMVFKRYDYDQYDSEHYLLYSDLDENLYPRETLSIQSNENTLTGFLYGTDNTKGLLVISPGHSDANDIKLYEIMYFVDAGWQVLCYDYTGSYNSQGDNVNGYTQSVHDLDAVLDYVEVDHRLQNIPIMLFGHSLGAYASAAVLQYNPNVSAAIIASGFDTPNEQWTYSIERYTGIMHSILTPFTKLFITLKYGEEQNLSAIAGINSTDIPILVISGIEDEFYGGESPIYKKRKQITNPNCRFVYKNTPNHNGHYDYFLSDTALAYQALVKGDSYTGKIDKVLYNQHDLNFMDELNQFLLESIIK